MSAKLQQNPSSRFFRKVEIRKQVPQQQQQQKSGVSYRTATKVAAKKLEENNKHLLDIVDTSFLMQKKRIPLA